MSTHEWDRGFEQIKEEVKYYPGSSKAIVRHPNRVTTPTRKATEAIDPTWDDKPRLYPLRGVPTEFFTVGQLARALGRESVTIRKWERLGIIPRAIYQVPGKDGDERGRRRLYTRAQVEGIIIIAAQEGLFSATRKPFDQTAFRQRVLELFRAGSE